MYKKFTLKINFAFLVLISICNICCGVTNKNLVDNKKNQNHITKDTLFSDWKKYQNNDYRISFSYPKNWIVKKEENSINLKGETMSKFLYIEDVQNNSILFLEYHVSPYGKEIFELAKNQYDNSTFSKKAITISNNIALQTNYVITEDIKGNIYNPPLNIVEFDFLDKEGKGEYHLRFQSNETNDNVEVEKFYKLISSIQLLSENNSK